MKEHSDSRTTRFAQRFGQLTQGDSIRALSEKLDIPRATVGAYRTGERMPKTAALEKIASHYGVDPMWLSGSDVPKYPQPSGVTPVNVGPMFQLNRVPRLGTIACGEPILAQQNIEDYDWVPSWAHCDFTLVCKGDSMIGARIYDGDVVCIHAQPEVENGEIAAVLIEDEATLKRVRYYEDHIVLEPENPNYRPLSFWDEEMSKVRILGRATHFISPVR